RDARAALVHKPNPRKSPAPPHRIVQFVRAAAQGGCGILRAYICGNVARAMLHVRPVSGGLVVA
ncbi:MAG TPA: hypothetical protein VIR81_11675, partial [Myxococcales bacterium]